MTADPLTPEETYRYQERLAILCQGGEPTQIDIEMARGDVRRFREESENYERIN